MMKILCLLFFCSPLYSQNWEGFYYSFDSARSVIKDKRYFILGESHYSIETTHPHIINLIENLSGNDTIQVKLYIETPPVCEFLAHKYLDGDSLAFKRLPLHDEITRPLLDSLVKRKVKLEIIASDTYCAGDGFGVHIFTEEMFGPEEVIGGTPDIHDLYLGKEKAIVAFAKRFFADSFLQKQIIKQIVKERDKETFIDNMDVLARYGFVRAPHGSKGFDTRDRRMAEVIDKNYHLEDPSYHIFIVGKAHIAPYRGELVAKLLGYIKNIPRKEMVIIPLLYEVDYYRSLRKKYPNSGDWEYLYHEGAVDMILKPNIGLDLYHYKY